MYLFSSLYNNCVFHSFIILFALCFLIAVRGVICSGQQAWCLLPASLPWWWWYSYLRYMLKINLSFYEKKIIVSFYTQLGGYVSYVYWLEAACGCDKSTRDIKERWGGVQVCPASAKMTQLVMYRVYKHNDLSLDPQPLSKSQDVPVCICNISARGTKRGQSLEFADQTA